MVEIIYHSAHLSNFYMSPTQKHKVISGHDKMVKQIYVKCHALFL